MKYILFECGANKIKNAKNIGDRYHPALRKYLKKGDNGFVFFGYGYELVEDKGEQIQNYTTEQKYLATRFYLLNGDKEAAFRYVRSNREGYKPDSSNSFENSNTCDVYFDYPNGFSLAQRMGCEYMDKVMCDYVLALSYIKKINDREHSKYKGDDEVFMINPLYNVSHLENAIWDKLKQTTKLESKLNQMCQKIQNDKNALTNKYILILAAISALMATISAIPTIKDILSN